MAGMKFGASVSHEIVRRDPEGVADAIRKALAMGLSVEAKIECVNADGETVWTDSADLVDLMSPQVVDDPEE